MSNITHTSAAKRGASYLLILGVLGALVAACLVVAALTELWVSPSLSGIGALVFGALFGSAAFSVLKLGREA